MPNKVIASFEDANHIYCVDVFVREDGSFGFEEFRSELEGDARWQCLNKYAMLTFASGERALCSAQEHVPWLDKTLTWRW
jgi:hypothetical protein